MNDQDCLEAYRKCQSLTKDYYNLSGEQQYIEPFIVEKNGAKTSFKYMIGTKQSRQWYEGQNIDTLDVSCLSDAGIELSTVVSGDVVLDCGAHTGFLSTYFAKIVGPNGHVIAFDPFPQNTDLIEHNAILNGLENISVVQKAVGARIKSLVLSQDKQNAIEQEAGNLVKTYETTIDAYVNFKPTSLKLDVEGYEVEALIGAQKVLKTKPRLNIEIHGPLLHLFGHSVRDVLDLLPGLDQYDYYICETIPVTGVRLGFRKLTTMALNDAYFMTMLGFPK
jgi:FkbM family methyltransferase